MCVFARARARAHTHTHTPHPYRAEICGNKGSPRIMKWHGCSGSPGKASLSALHSPPLKNTSVTPQHLGHGGRRIEVQGLPRLNGVQDHHPELHGETLPLTNFLKMLLLFRMYFCFVPMNVLLPHVCTALGSQKRLPDVLGL